MMVKLSNMVCIIFLLLVSSDDTVPRSEMEARARAAERDRAELRDEINENQRAIHQNQIAIAEMRERQAIWGTILTLLTGSGVIVTIFKRHKP